MTDRRDFIRSSLLATSGVAIGPWIYAKDKSNERGKEDDFWQQVRRQFPLTDQRTYFNNGTIGPMPRPVVDAVRKKMEGLNEWGEYSGHDDSREVVSRFVGVSKDEISLTHNTTEGINIVASGLRLEAGDEVIMTSHEHAGNALPWLNQNVQRGVVLRTFEPAPTADESLSRLKGLITARTRGIAIPHITCTTGHRLPIEAVCALGRERGLWTFVDGAHGPGTERLNLREMGCDFYAACGHKWLMAPAGTGFLYVRRDKLEDLKPHHIGAYSDLGWELSLDKQELHGYVPTAHRFDYGTQSAALAHGLIAAIEFNETIGGARMSAYSCGLATSLMEGLNSLGRGVEILTPQEEGSRSAMVGFRLPGIGFREFGRIASENKFRIRLVPESGLNSIRVSTHVYNNRSEVDRFVSLVEKVINEN